MEQEVFARHQQLGAYPPVKLGYIVYRRLVEQGGRPTFLWVWDKIYRRVHGVSPRYVSEIQPSLFVGGQQYRRGLARMAAWGISAVVNMREESDDAARGVAPEHYLWLPTTDDDVPTLAALQQGVDFIAAQRAAGRGVYIHCAAGVGRAPLMATAYLVSTGLTPAEAWAAIRQGRPFIRPTPPQYPVIEAFARSL